MTFVPPSLEEMKKMSIDELDRVYVDAPLLELPKQRFDGTYLVRLHNEGAKLQPYRFFEWLGFEAMPWGIDFARDDWFFFAPWLGAGRFRATPRRSRWRDTEALGLTYGVSWLPWFVKHALYDEVKPLANGLCIGLGGINADKGIGDHFFYALVPR